MFPSKDNSKHYILIVRTKTVLMTSESSERMPPFPNESGIHWLSKKERIKLKGRLFIPISRAEG